ncbi:hypothetical protein FB562_2188 [Homoserinimonas aerilata]|uniref:Uncharacterized protein n=1 Tax=Homoserinimonas aerilata TaxID=1162970 RepID=A0A542YFD0_9MICO|nr:hypothetical protein [Homoserinimonas aerilata]TQL46664.1 hypothetical protein FB562_2188 [Homoserinimonas aerilata]
MPEWLITSLIGLAIAVVGSGGVWLGAISSGRAVKKSGENSLIDQLQEELSTYRNDAGRRATAQDERLNRLEKHNDGYRAHIHDLRSHIWDGKQPPPPEWPADLPR